MATLLERTIAAIDACRGKQPRTRRHGHSLDIVLTALAAAPASTASAEGSSAHDLRFARVLASMTLTDKCSAARNAGHLSGKDRAASCPTRKLPSRRQ